jgi:glutamyl-Q tRNA(Asp) synthetase
MYIGRFAPSPTGPLHAGSLVAALASWLDARAHGGRWLVRLEDVDTPRCLPGMDEFMLRQLARCGLTPDEPPTWQSRRGALYQQALDQLVAQRLAYPCACTRKDIEAAQAARGVARARGAELPYPGTCRPELGGLRGRPARAWRLHTGIFEPNQPSAGVDSSRHAINFDISRANLHWHDRRLGAQRQDVAQAVGDFVLRRADGLWAYQLAVVVDDAAQGISHVVRGEDLADNTPRQMLLQRALGLPTPTYLHTPLVRAADGEKLSKQNGAQALELADPLAALGQAARVLDLRDTAGAELSDALAAWVLAWRARWAAPSMAR